MSVFIKNIDGWITIALPFGFCASIDKRKQRIIYLLPTILIQDFGEPYQASIGLVWFYFGLSFIYRSSGVKM